MPAPSAWETGSAQARTTKYERRMTMDYTKIAIAALSAVSTILAVTGTVSAEESTKLVTTGTAAATSLGAFVAVVVSIVRSRRGKGDKEA